MNYFRQKLMNLSYKIICQTNEQKNKLYRNFKLKALVVYNFHHPIKNLPHKFDKFTVIYVANVRPFKNYESFIRIVKELEHVKNINFIHVGKLSLHNLQQSLKLSNLESKGNINFDEVNNLISRSHLLVNTSFSEGFPNTFIQSWLSGVPVLSLSFDPDNIIQNHKLGFIGKTEKFSSKIIRNLSNNRNLLKNLSLRCQKYANANCSLDNIKEIEVVLNNV